MAQIIVCDNDTRHPSYSYGARDITDAPEAIAVEAIFGEHPGVLITPLSGTPLGSEHKTFCCWSHAEDAIRDMVLAMPAPAVAVAAQKETA